MAKKQFKAESKKLMDMMINSIYTHKEIFLRELISNASDAIDKLYFKSLTDDSIKLTKDDYLIKISADKPNRTLTIEDNGIGMTRQELEQNLGTIAKSGSLDFKSENKSDDVNIIGQFGVGFYSAFMVADNVTVKSRAYGADEAYRWNASGVDGYTIEPCIKDDNGTKILDENGEWDFEHIHAVDLELLNQQLAQMLRGEEVEIPFFNFEDGKRYFRGDKICLNPDNVLIIEGIHALNPELTTAIPREAMFKIYVSTLTTMSLHNHNWIPTTDTRLLRRIVRDYRYRNYSARETIARAPSVRRGEERWIFPFQEQADVMFNSALLFELAVLKRHAEPILSEVPQSCEEYTEAHRLLKFLKYFTPIHDREIPPTSLLREFLGGSSFRYGCV